MATFLPYYVFYIPCLVLLCVVYLPTLTTCVLLSVALLTLLYNNFHLTFYNFPFCLLSFLVIETYPTSTTFLLHATQLYGWIIKLNFSPFSPTSNIPSFFLYLLLYTTTTLPALSYNNYFYHYRCTFATICLLPAWPDQTIQ